MPQKRTIPRVCEACGKDFLALPQAVKSGYARYCGRACWRAHFGTTEQRFWSKVSKDGPVIRPELGACWVWTDHSDPKGYGRFGSGVGKQNVFAHRFSFALTHAVTLTPEQKICHRCDNPPCVRPDHLFEGTQADNLADMRAKGRHGGTRRSDTKLTEADVREIRRLFTAGAVRTEIARRFGINVGTMYKIAKRQMWRHVLDTPA